jgi:6-phosphogluconolactonase (cycloisomerase 2 family)
VLTVLSLAVGAGIATAAPGQLDFLQSRADGVDGDGLDRPIGIAVSPDGRNVYASGLNDDALAVFSRDRARGGLEFVEREDAQNSLDAPEGIALSPDGSSLYATGFASDTLVAFARDPATGALRPIDSERDAAGGVDGLNQADAVAVAPGGRHVYVTALIDDSLATFERDRASGALRFVEVLRDGAGDVDGLDAPEGLALSPDGRQVYVTADGDNSLAAFDRDPRSGRLRFVDVEKDGGGGVDGLGGAFGVAVSPDGRHVYTSSYGDNAVTAFARDGRSGSVSFVGTIKDGSGVDDLNGAYAVAVSPEGRYVYATGREDAALTTFRRAPGRGALTQVDVERQGTGGLDGAPAYGIALPPDARNVYATADVQDRVLVFSRRIVARCGGRRPTLWGTDFADRLRATRGRDVIAALGGGDSVSGRRGSDALCGGGGRDRLAGGRGRDRLAGGRGDDRLRGGKSRDRLLGGPGADRLRGGPGRDRLLGGSGRGSLRP